MVVERLVKRSDRVEAVRGISFSVRRGTTTALLGGNGAGKNHDAVMLLGVLEPTAGEVRVLGVDMRRDRLAALPRMNFTSRYVDLPKRLTVRANLRVYADPYGVERPDERPARRVSRVHRGDRLAQPRQFVRRAAVARRFRAGPGRLVGAAHADRRRRRVLLRVNPARVLDLLARAAAHRIIHAVAGVRLGDRGRGVGARSSARASAPRSSRWAAIFLFAPVSGVCYPIAMLPGWLQAVAAAIASCYVFEGMRAVIVDGVIRTDLLAKAVVLDVAYVPLGALFSAAVRHARPHGNRLQRGE